MKSTKESLELTLEELTPRELKLKEYLEKVLSKDVSVVQFVNKSDVLDKYASRYVSMDFGLREDGNDPMPYKVLSYCVLSDGLEQLIEDAYEHLIGGGDELLSDKSFSLISSWMSIDHVDEFSKSKSWVELHKKYQEEATILYSK